MRLRLPGDHTLRTAFSELVGEEEQQEEALGCGLAGLFFPRGHVRLDWGGGKGLTSRIGCRSFSLLSGLVVLKLSSTLNHSGSFKKIPIDWLSA